MRAISYRIEPDRDMAERFRSRFINLARMFNEITSGVSDDKTILQLASGFSLKWGNEFLANRVHPRTLTASGEITSQDGPIAVLFFEFLKMKTAEDYPNAVQLADADAKQLNLTNQWSSFFTLFDAMEMVVSSSTQEMAAKLGLVSKPIPWHEVKVTSMFF